MLIRWCPYNLFVCITVVLIWHIQKISTICTVVEYYVCRFSGTIELLLWKLTHEKARSHSTNKETVWLCGFWSITNVKRATHKELLNSVKCVFICTNVCIDHSAVVFNLIYVLDSHFSYLAVLYNRINL